MAVVERSSTTVTRTVEGADQLKTNLALIAAEVQKVRDQAQSEVGTLERIRQMLDAGYLTNLLQTVTALETRIRELEGGSYGSGAELQRTRQQLQEEQKRLEKLWDAYKAQEDELTRIKRDYPLMEEKLFERERTIEALRRDVARLEPLGRYKAQSEQMERDNHQLRTEVAHLQGEMRRMGDRVQEAERQALSLQELAPMRGRVDELEGQLEEERERLAKLYKVYEDLETEKKAAEARVKKWEEWFRRLQPAMEQICGSAGGPPGT